MKTKVICLDPRFPDLKALGDAAKVLRRGGLVVFPTETVYGLAADFANAEAMRRLRELKDRPEGKPFSILIAQRGLITNYTSMSDPVLYKVLWEFCPGPLTLVVPARDGETTIGVRVPDNLIAAKLVQEAQLTVAAPSANAAGMPPPRTCQEALANFDGRVELALDGGPCRLGRSSTVVDMTVRPPKVLREGAITQADIDQCVTRKTVVFICTGNSCRSVMAEYLLKSMVGDKPVDVYSAGTSVFLQSRASAETLEVLREEGIDAGGHVSRPINSILLKKADLIFVMTRQHLRQVLERVPEVEKRVYLLKEFVDRSSCQDGMDVPDPMGQSRQAYKDCLRLIKEAMHKIVDLI